MERIQGSRKHPGTGYGGRMPVSSICSSWSPLPTGTSVHPSGLSSSSTLPGSPPRSPFHNSCSPAEPDHFILMYFIVVVVFSEMLWTPLLFIEFLCLQNSLPTNPPKPSFELPLPFGPPPLTHIARVLGQ